MFKLRRDGYLEDVETVEEQLNELNQKINKLSDRALELKAVLEEVSNDPDLKGPLKNKVKAALEKHGNGKQE
jgi:uncharacterized coiled-coil DUF342 family protein